MKSTASVCHCRCPYYSAAELAAAGRLQYNDIWGTDYFAQLLTANGTCPAAAQVLPAFWISIPSAVNDMSSSDNGAEPC